MSARKPKRVVDLNRPDAVPPGVGALTWWGWDTADGDAVQRQVGDRFEDVPEDATVLWAEAGPHRAGRRRPPSTASDAVKGMTDDRGHRGPVQPKGRIR